MKVNYWLSSVKRRPTGVLLVLLAIQVIPQLWVRAQPPALYTPAPDFSKTDHYVSTLVFHWQVSESSPINGPWLPIVDQKNSIGETGWWKGQVKQIMSANIDVLYVHLMKNSEEQRMNLFKALSELRAEGYDTPKIAPYLDPAYTWSADPIQDLAQPSVKDDLVNQYIRFYEQYFDANTDEHADDYLARQDDKPILSTFHTKFHFTNLSSLTRTDVSGRLAAALGAEHPYFNNGIVMVTTALNTPVFAFADEQLPFFETNEYFFPFTFNSTTTVQLKGGYWDQNVINPGNFVPRDGGVHYRDAWAQVDRATAQRVYVESWSDLTFGTGILAVDTTTPPFVAPANTSGNTDTWSSTNDPFEYIKTTAAGAASFNDTPEQDAQILWHNIPASMAPGESRIANIVVRNTGDDSWTAIKGYQLVQGDSDIELVEGKRVLLDDTMDEITVYGGIFRGRAKVFSVSLTAPDEEGSYLTNWQMNQDEVGRFGEDLDVSIEVKPKAAGNVVFGNETQVQDGTPRQVSFTTFPAGLDLDITYNGSSVPPVEVGVYTVAGFINDPDYAGKAYTILVVSPERNLIADRGGFELINGNASISTPPDVQDATTFPGWRFFNVDSANITFNASITDHASTGNQAMRLSVDTAVESFNYALDNFVPSDRIPIQPGTHYSISLDTAWVAGIDENNLLLRIEEYNEAGEFLNNAQFKTFSINTTEFTSDAVIYQPLHPDAVEISLAFVPMAGQIGMTTIDIDNIQVRVVPPNPNGDFETGKVPLPAGGTGGFFDNTSIPGWRLFSLGTTPIVSLAATFVDSGNYTGGRLGSRAVRLEMDNSGTPVEHNYALDTGSHRIPVIPGTTYIFSVDAAVLEGPVDLLTSVIVWDAAGAFIRRVDNIIPSLPEDETFHHYSYEYTVTDPNVASVFIAFRPVTSGHIVLMIDNASFVPYVDPALLTGLRITRSEESVELNWPETHLGWQLQSNRVDIRVPEQWIDIPGTATSTTQSLLIQPEFPNAIYRLRSP